MDGMKTRKYKVRHATCQVRSCTAIPEKMRARAREIVDVYTKPSERKKGYATTLLHNVCRDADAANTVLILFPQPYHHSDDEDGGLPMELDMLVAWYETNFGFQITQTEPEMLMMRPPGATPRLLGLEIPVLNSMTLGFKNSNG